MSELKAIEDMSEEEMDAEIKTHEVQAKKDKLVGIRDNLEAQKKNEQEELHAQIKKDAQEEILSQLGDQSGVKDTLNADKPPVKIPEDPNGIVWGNAERQKFRLGNGSNYALQYSGYEDLIDNVVNDSYMKIPTSDLKPEQIWGINNDENFWLQATNDTSAANWIPSENYVNDMIEAAVCHSQLSGVITRKGYDVNKGEGGRVDIPYTPARTAQGPIGACDCLADTSSTLGKYYVTLSQYGDSDMICDFTEFKSRYNIKANIAREMGVGLAAAWDTNLWNALVGFGAPTYSYTLGNAWSAGITTDDCCMNAFDLYNGIIQLTKQLQGAAYKPTHVIMHPTVAAHLYYKDGSGVAEQQLPLVRFNNGKLSMVGELEVIESCNATEGSVGSGYTLAVIIDKSRSIAEAWGKKPTFGTFYELQCNRTRLAVWSYWGNSVLEQASIGHILNP